jgi:hypothetical protein
VSVLWIYKLANVVVVIEDDGLSENKLNVSTSISIRSLRHVTLGLYSWFLVQNDALKLRT